MNKALISLLLAGLFFLASCNSKRPQISLSKQAVNLDTIIANEEKSIAIIMRNTGDEEAIIQGFDCSCECTLPQLKKGDIIKAHDSLKLQITVKGYPDDKGKWKRVLCTFKTNADSAFSTLNLKYFTKLPVVLKN